MDETRIPLYTSRARAVSAETSSPCPPRRLISTVPALTPTLIGGNSGDVDNNMDDEYADPTALHTLDNATDDLAGFPQYFCGRPLPQYCFL